MSRLAIVLVLTGLCLATPALAADCETGCALPLSSEEAPLAELELERLLRAWAGQPVGEATLELEEATLGGLAMAVGMTTHAHVCGLLQETVIAFRWPRYSR